MLAILAAVVSLGFAPHPMQSKAPTAKAIQLAASMCTKTGDRVSGSNRICTYKCLGGDEVITVPATEFCPLSINR